MPDWSLLITIGIIFIILGFLSLAIGIMSSAMENEAHEKKGSWNTGEESGEKIKGAGVILIGPIPIVFGTDKRSAILAILLAIALMMVAMIYLK